VWAPSLNTVYRSHTYHTKETFIERYDSLSHLARRSTNMLLAGGPLAVVLTFCKSTILLLQMARLESPTSIEMAGPWLIEARHLLALDKLYDEYAPRLEKAQNAWIDEEIEEYVERDAPENASSDMVSRIRDRIAPAIRGSSRFARSRRATVYLSGGRTLQAERFAEILNHATVTNEVPLGFRSSLNVPPSRLS
jgi:hypothetical protein